MIMISINSSSAAAILTALCGLTVMVQADDSNAFLPAIHRHITLTSTVADNGDLNPYAIIVAPVSAGKIQKGDILIDNFNNLSNLQGTGTTICDYNPSTKKIT